MMYGYIVFCIVFQLTSAVEPPYYIRALDDGNELNPNELIEKYFHLGLQAAEILGFISNVHGFTLSIRQLKRILRDRGCRRRKEPSEFDEVVRVIEIELASSSSLLGYRAMHQKLTNDHGLVVTRNVVRQILKVVNPEGVQARSHHCLRRRRYCAKEANYTVMLKSLSPLHCFPLCDESCLLY